MKCRECGGEIPPRLKPTCGAKPTLCSEQCRKENRRRYFARWSEKHRDSIAEYRAARLPKWNKDFYARHRERRRKAANDWYHLNSEKALKAQKQYAEANPDKVRTIGRRSRATRRARIKGVFVEQIDPAVVFERSRGECGICSQPIDPASEWHVDHIVPLAKGGAHSYANVQAAHGRCNRANGART